MPGMLHAPHVDCVSILWNSLRKVRAVLVRVPNHARSLCPRVEPARTFERDKCLPTSGVPRLSQSRELAALGEILRSPYSGMANIGRRNLLPILRSAPPGYYLDGGTHGEILLPGRYIPKGVIPGGIMDVFVYRDSEDRLVA